MRAILRGKPVCGISRAKILFRLRISQIFTTFAPSKVSPCYMTDIFNRSELLLGEANMARMTDARVIIFGVGGVGSWCAECLVRTGVTHLTLVDADRVCTTNINRQLMATSRTVGQPKVVALRDRLLEINPEADIVAVERLFSEETKTDFALEQYDYVIDAIDSLRDKIALVCYVTSLSRPVLFSSMGAALRIDPTRVRVAEFWKVEGDPLARAMRSSMRRHKLFPQKKFRCVYSEEEPLKNLGKALTDGSNTYTKVQTNGSLCHITAIFGMTLAGLLLRHLTSSQE